MRFRLNENSASEFESAGRFKQEIEDCNPRELDRKITAAIRQVEEELDDYEELVVPRYIR